ncbi:MAG: ATP-binding cassette domain-containing protein [Gammaproteobacteria bacterium]|nr:ATP-binding cassette domain-containing protein [Gammaproteobacteria bacterium]
MTSKDTVIVAEAVDKQISSGGGSLAILRRLSLSVAAGQSVAILGRSGSGKTTLLSLLAGLDLPDAGRIWLDGSELTALDEDGRASARAGRVGFVFQSFQLLAGLSALENVMLPAELAGAADARARAAAVLSRVGLGDRLRHRPRQLSGGEQQRVALARAFVVPPRVLFADEPTGNLDTATAAEIIEQLFEFNRRDGTTLVLVTHDPHLAGRCQRTLLLEDGRLHE